MLNRNFLRTLLLLLFAAAQPVAHASGGGGEAPPSAYYELDPPFVVNVHDGKRMRFMQVEVQLKTEGPRINNALEHHMPAVRHAMIMLLAHKEAAEVRQPAGRQSIRYEAVQAIQRVLMENAGQATGVEDVYFTDLVIQ